MTQQKSFCVGAHCTYHCETHPQVVTRSQWQYCLYIQNESDILDLEWKWQKLEPPKSSNLEDSERLMLEGFGAVFPARFCCHFAFRCKARKNDWWVCSPGLVLHGMLWLNFSDFLYSWQWSSKKMQFPSIQIHVLDGLGEHVCRPPDVLASLGSLEDERSWMCSSCSSCNCSWMSSKWMETWMEACPNAMSPSKPLWPKSEWSKIASHMVWSYSSFRLKWMDSW